MRRLTKSYVEVMGKSLPHTAGLHILDFAAGAQAGKIPHVDAFDAAHAMEEIARNVAPQWAPQRMSEYLAAEQSKLFAQSAALVRSSALQPDRTSMISKMWDGLVDRLGKAEAQVAVKGSWKKTASDASQKNVDERDRAKGADLTPGEKSPRGGMSMQGALPALDAATTTDSDTADDVVGPDGKPKRKRTAKERGLAAEQTTKADDDACEPKAPRGPATEQKALPLVGALVAGAKAIGGGSAVLGVTRAASAVGSMMGTGSDGGGQGHRTKNPYTG